jgi:hypothetical protein
MISERIGSIKRFKRHLLSKQQSSRSLCHTFLSFVVGLAALLGMAGCATNAAKTSSSLTPLISVSITQAPPLSLTIGSTAQVSAMVNDDLANEGVDWVATCGSASNCGSFSPSHTASGATTTFTAPLAAPASHTVAVTALSTTDHSKASASNVTIISTITAVTITQPPPQSFPAGGSLNLAATVTGDPSNSGVDWKATCSAIDCTSGFNVTHSASGVTQTFVVPGQLNIPTIVGSTVTIAAFATADHTFNASASFIVTAPISINITQAPANTILTNAHAPVIAVVADDPTNSGVDWTIVSCDAAPCGSWSTTGPELLNTHTASGGSATYTAPPSPTGHVIIQAAASASPITVFATVEISITAPISIAITTGVPTGSVVENNSAPLVATVNNDLANGGVDWTVTCGSAGACGSFSPTHTASGATTTFTAPVAVPAGSTVAITATSTTDTNKSATETVTVTSGVPPNSLLLGQFVMLLSGKNSSNGSYFLGGVLTGDGTGNITSGALDLADASGNASSSVPVISPSTYSIGPDGRGQIHLLINTGALNGNFGVNGSGAIILSVVFVSPQHALLSETDGFGSATGTLDLQSAADLASFQQGAWTNGIYSLKLSGVEASNPKAGYFVASAVTIDFSASSYSYVADQSDNGVITSVPFATASNNFHITRDQNGKLTFVPVNLGLPTHFNLDAWLIDATHFAITDWRDSAFGTPPVIITGYLTQQPSSPSVSGTYAFTEAGATTAAQPQAAGGIFTCGSTGTLDVAPLGGTVTTNQPITAACTPPTSGRGLITISGAGFTGINTFAAYPTLDQGLDLIELDGGSSGTSGPSGTGVALQQTLSIPVSASTLTGNYASNFVASTSLGFENFAAQIVSDGVSALSGAADVNSFNAAVAPPVGTPSSSAALTGSFTAGTNGRFPLTLTITPATGQPTPEITTINSACYLVDVNTCLLLGLDATTPGTGILQLQKPGL